MKTLLLALALAVTLPAWGERLYVTNERAGTVQVIDTARDAVGRVRSAVPSPRLRGEG